MKRLIKILCLLLITANIIPAVQISGQVNTLTATISGLPDQMVYLARYYKDKVLITDSIRSMNGDIHFIFGEAEGPGTRWLLFGSRDIHSWQAQYIEFIYDRTDLEIYGTFPELSSTIRFVNSEENVMKQKFDLLEDIYSKKFMAILSLLDTYPSKDEYLEATGKYFETIQKKRDDQLMAISDSFPGTYLSALISAYRQPVVRGDLSSEERIAFLREHYFDLSGISNPDLLASPVYNHRIIEYLSLYKVRTGIADQEKAFEKAVDVIMANTSSDPELRGFVVEYLLGGFESFQMEDIQTYIADNYVGENCKTDAVELAMERINGYRKMAVGQTAPDIIIRDDKNKTVCLSDSRHKYTAVVFWASYCEHCQKMIPDLVEWYNNEKNIDMDILSVSIDTVTNAWKKYSSDHQIPWTNAIEPLGWNGKAAGDYNVYATPTIFILDRKRTILAKPYTFREFVREVNKLD